MVRRQENLRDAAIASRISQSDAKGWKDSMRTIDDTVAKALRPPQPAAEKKMTSDEALSSFFGGVGKLKTKKQVQREINHEKRPPHRR